MALVLVLSGSICFAQDEVSNHLVTLDIPLLPSRKTVSLDRINDASINVGSVLSPWSENINYSSALTPEFGVSNQYLNFKFNGGVEKGFDRGSERKTRYSDLSLDVSIWKFMIGGDGFFENEEALGAIRGLEFNADFFRESQGYRTWAGLKFGNFARNFVSIKGGVGRVWTKGYKVYNLVSSDHLGLYDEDFETGSLSVESKMILTPRFSESVKVEGNYYKRIENSPDPQRFGNNEFGDVLLQGNFEVIPLLRFDFLRLMIQGSKRLGDQDALLFRNDPASFQVYLRIAF